MKFIPRANHIIGRTVIVNPKTKIILGDQTKQTKFVYVDAVGAGVTNVRVGDLLIPRVIGNINLEEIKVWRPFLEEAHVAFHVEDVIPDDLLVQTNDGKNYVPFESPDAAKPLGASPKEFYPGIYPGKSSNEKASQ